MAKKGTTKWYMDLVHATEGFRIEWAANAVKAINKGTGTSVTCHTSNFGDAIRQSDITRLKRIGWTLGLYEAQQANARLQRGTQAKAVTHRLNAALEKMGVYESPPPTREERVDEVARDNALTGVVVPTYEAQGMRFSLRKIGPDEAYDLIDNIPEGLDEDGNRAQRPESMKVSQKYAAWMLRGLWQISPHAIVLLDNPVTGKPYVMDGRRRMAAVQISETEQFFWVAEGFPKEVFLVIDKNDPRTVAHSLWVKGYKDTTNLQSVVRAVAQVHLVPNQDEWGSWKFSDEEHIKYLEKYPEIVESMPWGARIVSTNKGANKAAIIAAHALISRATEDKAAVDRWFTKFWEGDNLKPGEPVNALRKWFVKQQGKSLKGTGLTKRRLHLGQILRAWNATQEGEVMVEMSYSRPYKVPEPVTFKPRTRPVTNPFVNNPTD